jgi:hypothetical protein
MTRACAWRPAEKAADDVRTIWPPMLIQPVKKDAEERIDEGLRAATQWYCPRELISSVIAL